MEDRFRCVKCKRIRPRIVGITKICYRCQLFGVLLMQAWRSIITSPEMAEFEAEIEAWYA